MWLLFCQCHHSLEGLSMLIWEVSFHFIKWYGWFLQAPPEKRESHSQGGDNHIFLSSHTLFFSQEELSGHNCHVDSPAPNSVSESLLMDPERVTSILPWTKRPSGKEGIVVWPCLICQIWGAPFSCCDVIGRKGPKWVALVAVSFLSKGPVWQCSQILWTENMWPSNILLRLV